MEDLVLLGNRAFEEEDYDEACRFYHDALILGSQNPDVALRVGVAQAEIGRSEEAVVSLTKAIELGEDSDHSYKRRGLARLRLGMLAEAEQDFKEAAERTWTAPAEAGALENIGLVELHRENWDTALEQTERVNEVYEKKPWNWLIRAIAADKLDEKAIANAAYERWKQLKSDPDERSIKKYLPTSLEQYIDEWQQATAGRRPDSGSG